MCEQSNGKKLHIIYAVIIAVAVIALFAPGISFERSIFDDHMYIGREFNLVCTWENIIRQLSTPVLKLHSPLVTYTFMLDKLIWGSDLMEQGCRVQNILWHLTAMIFLYFTLCRLYFKRHDGEKLYMPQTAALFAALGVALHPQRLESVIWISERKDVLVMALGMMSIYFFIRAYERNRTSIAAPLLFLISFAAKPMLFTLPFILIAGMWAAERKFEWRLFLKRAWPFLAGSALYFVINFAALWQFAGGAAENTLNPVSIQLAARNYCLYFGRTLFPVPLTPFYTLFEASAQAWWYLAAAVAVWAAVLTMSFCRWRYRDVCCFIVLPLLFAYSMAVAPVVGLKVIGNADFADRYSYLPGVPIWIMLAAFAVLAAERFYGKRRLIVAGGTCFLLFMLINTILYFPAWRTKEAMLHRIMAVDPRNPVGLALYAGEAYEKGDFPAALEYVSQLDARNKAYELYQKSMTAMVLIRRAHVEEGMKILYTVFMDKEWYKLKFAPNKFTREMMTTAAGYYIKNRHVPGNLQYAINLFTMLSLIWKDIDMIESLNYQAIALIIGNRYAEAEKVLLQALTINPDDSNLQKNLSSVRRKLNAPPAAELPKQNRPAAE